MIINNKERMYFYYPFKNAVAARQLQAMFK